MEPKIRIDNIYKKFGDHEVLKGVSLDIYPGEIMYIIGKSGSGKSVMLKNIVRLMKPDKGTIQIDGADIFSLSDKELIESRKKTGVLFQMAALFDSMDVYNNVAFSLRRHYRLTEEEIDSRVREKLTLVGLKGYEKKFPADLSMGMQKRVGLARAISVDPEIILCDEPTTGVDPLLGAAVDSLIRDLNRELGVTVLVISHDMNSVFRLAHRVAMLYQGGVEFLGTPEEMKKSDNQVVKQFRDGVATGPIPIL